MTHFSCARKLLYIFIIFFVVPLFIGGCAQFSKQLDLPSDADIAADENSGVDDSDSDIICPSESPDSIESAAIDDDEDNTIDYLPLIPFGDENCNEESESPENVSINAVIQAKLDEALDFYQASQDFWQQGELDNALQALDQAYALITEVDGFDQPKLIQQKDDLRFMISKRILEIYTSRHITAKGNHNAIPLVMNTHVQKEIDLFTQNSCRNFFKESYKRSGRYRQHILSELQKAGLPEELSWLPLIESGFKVNALSSARALGLWQFISSTGHKFGLKRDLYIDERLDPYKSTQAAIEYLKELHEIFGDWPTVLAAYNCGEGRVLRTIRDLYIDERLDPYKSTQAAIEYLKELHEIFGDWPTVLAAYNCGEGRVLRTIRDQNVSYLDDFWDLYQRLPRETARYVPKFMATLHIINNPEKYGMTDIVLDDPVQFDTQVVSKQAYLKDVAEAIKLQEKELVSLNPELRYKLLPAEEYPLRIPVGMKETLIASIDDIPEYAQTHPGISFHRVRPGETLSTIARRYNINVNTLAKYNNIYQKNYIAAGKILKIPQAGKIAGIEESKIITYYVRRGDSLWTLAKRYDTTTKKIQEFNQLKSASLDIGQKLKIPTGPHRGLSTYKVKNGDSASKIASKHNMTLNQLMRLNNLTKNSTIYPGQQLYVE